jgi:hypothetical protein
MPDTKPFRLLSLAAILCSATANIFLTFFFSHQYVTSQANVVIALGGIVPASIFIALRVVTAPSGSGVFPIAMVTSLVTGYLLYDFAVICNASIHCNLSLFLTIPVLCFGAFISLFPKWSHKP